MKGLGSLARVLPRRTVWIAGLLLFLTSEQKLDGAPTVLGPNKCTSCHDHDKQKQWADKDTHTKALEQLEDKEGKAKKYLAALGLSDPYNLKGPCVACHATVFNGDANAGVSCETCHGPGSAYLEPHQKKGSHKESVALGLINTRESYTDWAKLCVGCHVVTDPKLTAAGHSSGADFELAAKSKKIRDSAPGLRHWEPTYEDAKLAEAGRAAMRARGGGMAAPKPEAKPQTPTVTKPQPKASPTSAPPKTPAAEEKVTKARPSPTMTPTIRQPEASPTSVPAVPLRPTIVEQRAPAQPTAIATAAAPPTQRPTAPERRAPAASPSLPTTASPGIVIVIEVTPIPTTAPRVREGPTTTPTTIEAAPQAQTAPPSPRPTRRPTHRKPRPRPTARPLSPTPPTSPQAPQSQPTPTPTRIKAPATMSVPH